MSSIDKAHWQRLSPLLDELLDAAPELRRQRLQALNEEDPALAAELAELLAEHAAIDRDKFLEQSMTPIPGQAGLAGTVVDRYRLDRQLGEGGMGSVWLAHRNDGRYEGQVAIKFLSLPAMGTAGLQRFEREGHVLARLKHPNIAHLIDAGVTPSGQPYLVLEYVEGEPIDQWCADRGIDLKARIELFLQVSSAVSHAHSKLILHRDLKPSNILVTADGQVKLLDFGIAKLLEEADATGQPTEMTRLAGRAFTLDYAAPEQIQGGDVTTATDVYSLGVLLYVVLTDQHPTAGHSIAPAERIRAVLDTEPKRPSVAVASTGKRGTQAAQERERARALRGDLDNIVTKALKKQPGERYATVEALAADLRRYLSDEPVSARPDSLAYRARKFVSRNALPVAAATIVVASLIAASAVSLWQAREATRQRDRALAMSARNAAVVDFVNSMLTEVAPGDRAIRVSELLERSREMLLTSTTDPEHQAAILDLLAEYYLSTGDPGRARPLLDRAVELTAQSGDEALKATLLCNRGHALQLASDTDAALQALEQGIAGSQVEPLAAARCLQKRAYLAQSTNDPANALKYTLEAQARLSEAPMQRPEFEATLLSDLAYANYLAGRTAEADRYYAEALSRYKEIGRGDSPATFSLRNNWGIASYAAGDNRRALENYDEALRIARQRDPDADPPVYLLANRALALASLARYEEAFDAFDVALAASERSNNVASILHALVNRAGTHLLMGNADRAERELAQIEERYGAMLPPNSVPAITIMYLKGRLALARQQPESAAEHLTKTIEFFDERKMSVAPLTRALNTRSETYLRQGKLEVARADAQRALEISRKLQDAKPHSSLTGYSLLQLAEVESAHGREAEARRAANDALRHLSETIGAGHHDALRAKALAGEG